MGLKYRVYLDGRRVYGCSKCRAHLSTDGQVISRNFHGEHGTAFLFKGVVNVDEDAERVDRIMTTGRHTIVTIRCARCSTTLGWKYIKAHDDEQQYKEGKYILEKALLKLID